MRRHCCVSPPAFPWRGTKSRCPRCPVITDKAGGVFLCSMCDKYFSRAVSGGKSCGKCQSSFSVVLLRKQQCGSAQGEGGHQRRGEVLCPESDGLFNIWLWINLLLCGGLRTPADLLQFLVQVYGVDGWNGTKCLFFSSFFWQTLNRVRINKVAFGIVCWEGALAELLVGLTVVFSS